MQRKSHSIAYFVGFGGPVVVLEVIASVSGKQRRRKPAWPDEPNHQVVLLPH